MELKLESCIAIYKKLIKSGSYHNLRFYNDLIDLQTGICKELIEFYENNQEELECEEEVKEHRKKK